MTDWYPSLVSNDETNFTLIEDYRSENNDNINFILIDIGDPPDPPELPEFIDPGIGSLPLLPLGQKITTVAYNPVFLIILLATFIGGYMVDVSRNAWAGIFTVTMVVVGGYMIGYVPLGVVFAILLVSMVASVAIQSTDRLDNIQVNMPNPTRDRE